MLPAFDQLKRLAFIIADPFHHAGRRIDHEEIREVAPDHGGHPISANLGCVIDSGGPGQKQEREDNRDAKQDENKFLVGVFDFHVIPFVRYRLLAKSVIERSGSFFNSSLIAIPNVNNRPLLNHSRPPVNLELP
jgi:hypothetical protein